MKSIIKSSVIRKGKSQKIHKRIPKLQKSEKMQWSRLASPQPSFSAHFFT